VNWSILDDGIDKTISEDHTTAERTSEIGVPPLNKNLTNIALLLVSMTSLEVHESAGAKSKTSELSTSQNADATCFRQVLSDLSAEQAEEQIANFLKANPDATAVRVVHAESLYKLARYHYAMDELRRSMQTRIDDPEDALLMGKICQSMHKSKDAVEWYGKFISLSPKDERVTQYETLQRVLQQSIASDVDKHRSVQSAVGNYLAAVTQNAMMRWPSPENIKVNIKDGTGIPGYRPEFEEALRQAFDEWSESSQGKINFTIVPLADSADMTVTWSSDLHAPALQAEAGLATTSYRAKGLSKAEILLLTVDPFKDGPVGKNSMYNICLHEIGHALGLQGHSPTQGDIMYPSIGVQQGLSERDINTLTALYANDLTSITSLSDKDEYGRALPPSVMCDRLTNVGSAAAMNGDFQTAIEKLQAALSINPSQDLAKKNLCVAANNLAIVPGTSPEKAISLLHLALYWDPKNEASRQNLNSLLQSQGKDPTAFKMRVESAESCQSHNDIKGAIVEYTEALSIKSDDGVKAKLKTLKSSEEKK
jgi:predicted Zn-dependent protease/Tfp pilus assembly protein PilF